MISYRLKESKSIYIGVDSTIRKSLFALYEVSRWSRRKVREPRAANPPFRKRSLVDRRWVVRTATNLVLRRGEDGRKKSIRSTKPKSVHWLSDTHKLCMQSGYANFG